MPSNLPERESRKFRDASGSNSKVAVTIEQDPSSPIPVYVTDSVSELNLIEFDEITSVPNSTLSDVQIYTVPMGKKLKLKTISLSGDNIAEFSIMVDNVLKEKIRTWWTDFNKELKFDSTFEENTEIKIRVIHSSLSLGSFNSTIKGELI